MSFPFLKSNQGKFLFSFGIAISIGCLFLFNIRKNKPIPLEINSPEILDFTSVAALGQITPAGDKRILSAPLSGFGASPRIESLMVKEGDFVEKDQLLVVFENQKQILLDIKIKKLQISAINDNISYKSQEVKRYQEAVEEGAAASLLFAQKENSLKDLLSTLEIYKAELNLLYVDLERSSLLSPFDGIILKINTFPGERPSSNQGVIEIGSNKNMEAIIEVYESDISKIYLDQKVTLESENGGFSGLLYGTVSLISPQVNQRKVLSTDPTGDADARVVEVRVVLESESSLKVSKFTGMKVIALFDL